MSPKRS